MTLRRPSIRSRSPAAAGSARPQEIAATRVARIIERYSASVHNAMLAPRAHVWRSTPRARALSSMQSMVGAANRARTLSFTGSSAARIYRSRDDFRSAGRLNRGGRSRGVARACKSLAYKGFSRRRNSNRDRTFGIVARLTSLQRRTVSPKREVSPMRYGLLSTAAVAALALSVAAGIAQTSGGGAGGSSGGGAGGGGRGGGGRRARRVERRWRGGIAERRSRQQRRLEQRRRKLALQFGRRRHVEPGRVGG